MHAERTEIGSVMTAIAVIRHWPRNSRIVSEQRTAPEHPLLHQAGDRLADEDRLVHDQLQLDPAAGQPVGELLEVVAGRC